MGTLFLQNIYAVSSNSNLHQLEAKYNVPLDKIWTITFSGSVTKDKIKEISIYNEEIEMPVVTYIIEYNKMTVKPLINYNENAEYNLYIELMNGNKYSMSFTTQTNSDKVIEFEDENLETLIRITLDIPEREITESDMLKLQYLSSGPHGFGITSLKGLEYAKNLEYADLMYNRIEDLSPLSGLSQLYSLDLRANGINDSNLKRLNNLNNLKQLGLLDNNISDISSLAQFSNLEELILAENKIIDISPLANLTKMKSLDLNGNQIVDIHFLGSMEYLYELWLLFVLI